MILLLKRKKFLRVFFEGFITNKLLKLRYIITDSFDKTSILKKVFLMKSIILCDRDLLMEFL